MVHGEGRESLKEEETEGETDTVLDWRGWLSSMASSIGTLGKLDESLTER